MRHKPIPIYAERKERDTGYTIFLDSSTNKVYRAFHKDYNQTTYWIMFALTLGLLRAISGIYLTQFPILIKSAVVIFIGGLGIGIGKLLHKKYTRSLVEIFLNHLEIKELLKQGKKLIKIEIIFISILLIISLILAVLFIIYSWIVWLVFTFMLFTIVGVLLNSLSVERIKLLTKDE
ncbi:hypothetical protein AQ616_11895 [Oceanobacillus sp. E9]|uniref:hypothetical protein n=1 Tax=Oceanobacillus TaxID=182709 RepID=UPI00084E4119|nr:MULTISPECIES: hypothetical protein [Oceanobacillus]OEH54453.1 hypothetical protein AQ616_11895 [Oceanobacillus sp. E9]